MQVRLTYRDHLGTAHVANRDTDVDSVGVGISVPDACPHADCGSRRLRLRQTVAKAVRGDHASNAYESHSTGPELESHYLTA